MKLVIITPAKVTSRTGNRNTALRWAGLLRQLGHRVRVQTEWDGGPADLMLALHPRKSHASIRRFHDAFSGRPLVLGLTGTAAETRHVSRSGATLKDGAARVRRRAVRRECSHSDRPASA